ncbi:MAG: hypothetical protein ABUL58_03215, partial [Steroidobacter sp.]
LVSGVCSARSHDDDDDFHDHSGDNAGNSGLGFVVSGAAEFGGDSVATVIYTDNSTQSVNAGQGVTVSVGGHYRFSSIPLDIMATVGYKYVTTKASNVNIYIGRVVPALQVSYWFTDSWWVGAGPTWHTNNEFHGGQVANTLNQDPNLKFDTALGATVQAGWKFVALTYTNIKYKDQSNFKYDASNFGLALIGRF